MVRLCLQVILINQESGVLSVFDIYFQYSRNIYMHDIDLQILYLQLILWILNFIQSFYLIFGIKHYFYNYYRSLLLHGNLTI